MPIWKQALLRRTYQEAADDGVVAGGGLGEIKLPEGEVKPPEGEQKSVIEPKKPSDEEARLLKESMKRKEALDKVNGELSAAKQLLAQLDELGGMDALKTLVTEKKDSETKQLEAKGEWDRLKARMAEEHNKSVQSITAKQSETEKALADALAQIDELTVGTAFSNSEFIRGDLLLTPSKTRVVFGGHFERVDGALVGYDKPRGAANRTPLVDASGTPVSFDEALRRIVDADPDKESLLRSKLKPGAGSDSKKTAAPTKVSGAEHLSGVDRISAGLSQLMKAK